MEPFSISCTTCQARLRVQDESAIGQILACPKCGSMVLIQPPAGMAAGPAPRGKPEPAASPTKPAPPNRPRRSLQRRLGVRSQPRRRHPTRRRVTIRRLRRLQTRSRPRQSLLPKADRPVNSSFAKTFRLSRQNRPQPGAPSQPLRPALAPLHRWPPTIMSLPRPKSLEMTGRPSCFPFGAATSSGC